MGFWTSGLSNKRVVGRIIILGISALPFGFGAEHSKYYIYSLPTNLRICKRYFVDGTPEYLSSTL